MFQNHCLLLLVSSCKGADGSVGPAGAQGPSGLAGVEVVSQVLSGIGAGVYETSVACPSGKVAIGGGFAATATAYATKSYPDVANRQNWKIAISNPGTTAQSATLYAICATAN